MQRRQVELLTALLETSQRLPVASYPVPPPQDTRDTKAPVQRESRIMVAAVAHLKANPVDAALSGRDLEKAVTIEGRTVSYKTWNEAKKKL